MSIVGWTLLPELTQLSNGYMIYATIIGAITLAIATIYLVQLIKVNKSLFIWTHIVFGYYVVLTLVNIIMSLVTMDTTAVPGFEGLMVGFTLVIGVVAIGGAIAVWITFYKHLLKAQKTKRLVFN